LVDRAIIGGLAVSVVLTVFIVPTAYFLFYRRKESAVKMPADAVSH
jgi:Cu/Ag efflux pump CusA